jgi:hypothetical protein
MSESPKKSSGRVVNPEVLQLAPSLLNAPLAAPWQRALGMAVDLAVIAGLSLLSHAVLGVFAGATLIALGGRGESPSRFWRSFRWVPIVLGAGVILASASLLGGGLLRSAAPGPGTAAAAPAIEPVLVTPNAGTAELRRAVDRLQSQVGALRDENERLRTAAAENPLLSAAMSLPRRVGLSFGWAGIYFTLVTFVLKGRTVGKLVAGTRVVRLDGRAPSAIDCFWRSGGYPAGIATGFLGFFRLIWEPNHQALQDNIAGTLVLNTRRPAAE